MRSNSFTALFEFWENHEAKILPYFKILVFHIVGTPDKNM